MVADKGKKMKMSEKGEESNHSEQMEGEFFLSVEKLQEIQDELEKVRGLQIHVFHITGGAASVWILNLADIELNIINQGWILALDHVEISKSDFLWQTRL